MGNTFSKNKFTKSVRDFFRKKSISEVQYCQHDWTEDQRKRLKTLLDSDVDENAVLSELDDGFIMITDFDEQFNLFVNLHQEWKDGVDGTTVFFRQYPSLEALKVLRRQRPESGLCFMHGPVVLQHYLVSIYNYKIGKRNEVEMIDVAKYISMNWKGEKLLNFLLYDNGGSSIDFLQEINYHVGKNGRLSIDSRFLIDPEDEDLKQSFLDQCEWFEKKLNKAPALVSNFEIDSFFGRASSGVSFLSQDIIPHPDSNKKNGRHAMVLIGIRQDSDHKYVFLLQNWWRGDPTSLLGRFFIEVSARYLFQARAIITFVNTDISSIPSEFPKVYKSYVETSVDICERMYEK